MRREMTHVALEMVEYGADPTLLVLADSEAGLARARRAATRAGCRVSAAAGIAEGAERLDRQVAMDAVLVDVENDHGAALDRLLDRLESAARTGRHGSVISAPMALIDPIAARAWHLGIEHLCDPDEAQQALAIGKVTAPRTARLNDISKNGKLQQLSEEVGRIAHVLASLSEKEALAEPPASEGAAQPGAAAIRAMIRARRLRDQYFQTELFADPAWDMLLDLMAARLDGQKVAVSSLCIAAAVPATTALRWIKTLTDHGLFVRTADPQDGRRVFIELSDGAVAQLGAYLRAAQRLSPLAI